MKESDALFSGAIPDIYDRCLGPLLFQPYATDLASRAKNLDGRRVIELAAGTGIATRALAQNFPDARIEATDLNESMVNLASASSTSPNVRWSVADGMALPFGDGSFDWAVCQFGIMFFPDRLAAFREVRRVLSAGGTFLFNVWDDLEHNDVARIVFRSVVDAFPDDPPAFLTRTPYGHGDTNAITRDLHSTGFTRIHCEPVEQPSGRVSAHDAAFGLCAGTPMRHEIVDRDASRLSQVIESATRRLQDSYGKHEVGGRMRAFIFEAR